MAGPRKHIGTLIFESALIGGGFAAETMLSQVPGWGWLAYSIVAGVVSIPLIYGSEIKAWWAKRERTVARTPSSSRTGTTPIQGISDLERCREALVKYMAIPAKRPASAAEIAGSAELYPYLTDLCRILDEQGIPHPGIEWDATTIVDTMKWIRFLGNLWAVRHDLERARQAYPPLRYNHVTCRMERPGYPEILGS